MTKNGAKSRLLLGLVLVASAVLRITLVLRGGQLYWPDETRYQASREAASALSSGNPIGALKKLHTADHFLFKIAGVVPALVETAIGEDARIPALFFSGFSVLCIWLVWRVVLEAGGSEREALCASVLLASSASFFYYSRHLVPYDLAMSLALGALLVAVKRPATAVHSGCTGLLAMAAFLTYSGYWTVSAFALLAHWLFAPTRGTPFIRRVAFSSVAFVAPFLLLVSLSRLLGGNLLGDFVGFSHTVTQGDFAEGWSLVPAYLWHAEHGILLLWAVALVMGTVEVVRRRPSGGALIGVSGFAFVYLSLVGASVGLHKFVVYGRLARQCVPFLCILGGRGFERWMARSGASRPAPWLVGVLCLVQAGFNFAPPLRQSFPAEFRRVASKSERPGRRYRWLFVHHIYPYPEPGDGVPGDFVVVRKARHPLQFYPYQYEGFDRRQREALRSTDISMRLVDVGGSAR